MYIIKLLKCLVTIISYLCKEVFVIYMTITTKNTYENLWKLESAEYIYDEETKQVYIKSLGESSFKKALSKKLKIIYFSKRNNF